LDEIEIHADDRGRPIVGGDWAGAVGARPVVSLAHTEGHAVALAALGGTVGIDIEPMRQPAPGFAAAAFTDRERELLGGLPAHIADEWALRCWCAKEALAKALGVGLSNPDDVIVTAVDAGVGRVEASITGALADLRPDLRGVPLTVFSLREDDLIVATTVCETGGALG
jgi:phosphopantetheinyl transferase